MNTLAMILYIPLWRTTLDHDYTILIGSCVSFNNWGIGVKEMHLRQLCAIREMVDFSAIPL